jgi:Fusaric acid resistance protein-like
MAENSAAGPTDGSSTAPEDPSSSVRDGAKASEAEHVEAEKKAPPSEADGGSVPDKPSGARRVLQILGAVLLGVVLPVALMEALAGKLGSSAMIVGLLYGVVGSRIGGTQRMLHLTPAVAVAAGLGAITAYDWSWVALLAIAGVIIGAGIRFGWLPPLLMVGFAATFATATSSGANAVEYGVIVGIATLYGIVLARRFKAPEIVEGQRVSLQAAILVAILFGIGLGGCAAIGVALEWAQPYWVPEPILILYLYIVMGKRERIREKTIGTAVGVIAVTPVAIIAPPALATSVIAGIAFLLSLAAYSKKYWLYYALFTFALVLALAPPGHAGPEAARRGSEILIGTGILVVGVAIAHVLANWLAKHYPDPELV